MRFAICNLRFVFLVALIGAMPSLVCAEPTSRPAVAKASVTKWFSDLADSDTALRDAARGNLLMLNRSDLPTLRDVVDESRPLMPSQAAVLHDIVAHVFLTGEEYKPAQNRPAFMGIQWPQELAGELDVSTGVPVGTLLPGFCAYTKLVEGDLILRVLDYPNMKFQLLRNFTTAIGSEQAGKTLRFEVMRQGRLIEIPITLDARPQAVMDDTIQREEFLGRRQQAAEDYWRKNFASLVEGGVS